jgi:hypothetical protein
MRRFPGVISAALLSLWLQSFPQPEPARNVTVAAIQEVVAAGAPWTLVWQGTDNADGIVGTADRGLLFAQEQPNRVRKLDSTAAARSTSIALVTSAASVMIFRQTA